MVDDAGEKVTLKRYLKKMLYTEGERFGRLGRLFNQYCCDMFSRMEDGDLDWQRHNLQKRIEKRRVLATGKKPGVPTEGKVYLPAKQKGSYAEMQHLMQDAFAIMRHYGKPSFFITLTCNPEWPEIVSRLRPGQCASERPDIVCRVFHQRFLKFKKWIMSGHSPFGAVEYLIHVVEFQKRGLPHVHMLVRSRSGPSCENLEGVDDVISCELPEDPDDRALVEKSDRIYFFRAWQHVAVTFVF